MPVPRQAARPGMTGVGVVARRANQPKAYLPPVVKIYRYAFGQISAISASSRPLGGAYHGRRETSVRDVMDAEMSKDERHRGGRRSRVVLAPRRWRQVCDNSSQATVARQPGHRGERGVSRKTIAQGEPRCLR